MTNQALEMLKTALAMEEKGENFYKKAANDSTNTLGREIFETLMKDEKIHHERIQVIYNTLTAQNRWTDEWKSIDTGHKNVRELFQKMAIAHGKTLRADPDNLQALDVGIDFEYKTMKFYEAHLQKAVDPLEKEFTEKMAAEERGHYTALKDMKFYLTDPSAWYQEKEHSGLDGA